MSVTLDQTTRDLVAGPNFAHVSVIREDGSVMSVVVWVELEGDNLIVCGVRNRQWPSNLERNGRATVSIHDQANPYSYAAFDTRLVETRTGEASAAILKGLCQKYMGVDELPGGPDGEVRASFVLEPTRIHAQG